MKDEWREQLEIQRVAESPNMRWNRHKLLFPPCCCCCRDAAGAVDNAEAAAEFELLFCRLLLLLKRGRLLDHCLLFLKPPFLTKLTSDSISSKAAVNDDCVDAAAAAWLSTMLLIEVADFSNDLP